MADVVSPEVRSRMMAGIRGTNTKPELLLRKGLHAEGFRYKLHDRGLPGRPDMVFPRYDAVIFAHGCFWHGHDCHLFKWPTSRPDFWRAKIARNRENDRRNELALAELGWRQAVVWECALKGRTRLDFSDVMRLCDRWLRSRQSCLEIRGVS
ncbi:very short patch repair endonuclease [Bradyrhizobium monzae]|uniref:very short patch repair endonuclease n=1 Tax=Bradyrhizobium sp. Oc8 TaxID=2876780 RepID=UPI001F2CF371|nr:very short patch repair endonuclease [Bradyrhizobium sp. Oc8]